MTSGLLRDLGVGPNAERAYWAMRAFPGCRLPHLAGLLGISVAEVQEAVRELASHHLVSISGEDTESWRLLRPRAGNGADVGIEKLRSSDSLQSRLDELIERCTVGVWLLDPEPGLQQRTDHLLARGLDVRSVHLASACAHEKVRERLTRSMHQGAQVRLTPSLPTRMTIIDRAVAVLPIDVEDGSQGSLVIMEESLVANVVALYQAVWRSAAPLGSPPRVSPQGLTDQEGQAIRLWAMGHKDSAVARKLGVSERTVRRINDKVTEKLRTKSRFQTGAYAVSEGIIESGDLV